MTLTRPTKNFRLLLLLTCLFITSCADKSLKLAACLTDNMVLQQNTRVNLWGKTTPGRRLIVTTSWNHKNYATTAGKKGDWIVKVNTPKYGGPYTITFDDGEITVLKNILIGEVWVCGGQSNMNMTVDGMYGGVLNAKEEVAEANYPAIRVLVVENSTSLQKQADLITRGEWQICSPATANGFPAAAYFFARELYKKKHIPVGLISASWGGSIAEAWTSTEALKTMPAFVPAVQDVENGVTQQQLEKRHEQAMRRWLDSLAHSDPSYTNGELAWTKRGYNTSVWKKMTLPNYWQKAGLPDFNGMVNFIREINIPSAWAGQDLVLKTDTIYNMDMMWFNGTEIGHTEKTSIKRNYIIPAKLISPDKNRLAIRVISNSKKSGFNSLLSLSLATDTDEKINLAGEWNYRVVKKQSDLPPMPLKPVDAYRPSLMYNAMIHPLTNYTIRGVIWYQGESNVRKAYQYRTLFPLLINDWRQKWRQGSFPFYFVQLASFMPPDAEPAESTWAELREAQSKTLSLPNTGMALAIDIGDANTFHPANKQEVGRRLALVALAKTYGEKINYSGPVYATGKINGKGMDIGFNFADGIRVKGDKLSGFAIAGADKKFYWADAMIKGNKVIVSSTQVNKPVAVRYDWGNNPAGNLYNAAGLPAAPFRTDNWPGITFGRE